MRSEKIFSTENSFRKDEKMTKKQKTVLYRIIASAILILGISILCEFADVNIWGQVVLYLIPI